MSDPVIYSIANGAGAWICALVAVSIVLIQSILYVRLSFKNAKKVGLTKKQCIKGLRSGMLSSIGPSIAVVAVVLSMVAIVGGPITWMRLSMIGAAPTELTAAHVGVQAMGVELGSKDFNLDALALAWWTLASNGIGWLVVLFFFNHRMEKVRQKAGGGDQRWLQLLTATATLGLFGYLASPYILSGGDTSYAIICSGLSMFVMMKLSDKKPSFAWLKEYALGFALIFGMLGGSLIG